MSTPGTLSVVVPAHNEERAIGDVLDRILAQSAEIRRLLGGIRDVEVIVVDDGSSDRTAEIVTSRAGVRLVSHERNRGYGAALKTGIRAASGDVIGFLDADGTYPPEALPSLVGELLRRDADIVTGSRMASGASGMPLVRRIGNRLFALLVSLVAWRRVGDSASGMRVARRSALARLGLLPDGMNFIVALATQALHERLHTVEVPIDYDERVGESKLRVVHDGLAFARVIFWISVLYNPLGFFALLGGGAVVAAVALATPPLWHWAALGTVPEDAIYRLVTVLVLCVGGFSIATFGILAARAIALWRATPPVPRGLVERVLLSPALPVPLALGGLALILFAPLVAYRAIWEYLGTAQITQHWSPIMLGAAAFLVGLQALLAGMLIRLLEYGARARAGWIGGAPPGPPAPTEG